MRRLTKVLKNFVQAMNTESDEKSTSLFVGISATVTTKYRMCSIAFYRDAALKFQLQFRYAGD